MPPTKYETEWRKSIVDYLLPLAKEHQPGRPDKWHTRPRLHSYKEFIVGDTDLFLSGLQPDSPGVFRSPIFQEAELIRRLQAFEQERQLHEQNHFSIDTEALQSKYVRNFLGAEPYDPHGQVAILLQIGASNKRVMLVDLRYFTRAGYNKYGVFCKNLMHLPEVLHSFLQKYTLFGWDWKNDEKFLYAAYGSTFRNWKVYDLQNFNKYTLSGSEHYELDRDPAQKGAGGRKLELVRASVLSENWPLTTPQLITTAALTLSIDEIFGHMKPEKQGDKLTDTLAQYATHDVTGLHQILLDVVLHEGEQVEQARENALLQGDSQFTDSDLLSGAYASLRELITVKRSIIMQSDMTKHENLWKDLLGPSLFTQIESVLDELALSLGLRFIKRSDSQPNIMHQWARYEAPRLRKIRDTLIRANIPEARKLIFLGEWPLYFVTSGPLAKLFSAFWTCAFLLIPLKLRMQMLQTQPNILADIRIVMAEEFKGHLQKSKQINSMVTQGTPK